MIYWIDNVVFCISMENIINIHYLLTNVILLLTQLFFFFLVDAHETMLNSFSKFQKHKLLFVKVAWELILTHCIIQVVNTYFSLYLHEYVVLFQTFSNSICIYIIWNTQSDQTVSVHHIVTSISPSLQSWRLNCV